MRKSSFALILACLLMSAGQNTAYAVILELSGGVEKMYGYTTYQIGGHIDTPEESGDLHFPLSELIFPLDVYMSALQAGITFCEDFKFSGIIKNSITSDAGLMEDSDWGVPWEDPVGSGTYHSNGPDSLDIYSESDTSVDAFIFDFNFTYRFLNIGQGLKLMMSVHNGYMYQKLNFECRLIQQWDYRENAPVQQDYTGDGSIGLAYDVDKYIHYIGVNLGFMTGDIFQAEVKASFAPIVMVRDVDYHILRSKRSDGNCNGYGWLISAAGQFNMGAWLFVIVQYDFVSTDTDGLQKQYGGQGEWTGTLEERNFSLQQFFAARAGIRY